MNAPIDLSAVWQNHVEDVLADRNPRSISASDLHSCPTAFWSRYNGIEELPYGNDSFSAFERGHAYETRCFDAVNYYLGATDSKLNATRWDAYSPEPLIHGGIEGHPDILLQDEAGDIIAVIDPTTTASKFAEWKYGHALKSAFYATALGCDQFCEWVFCIGFGGNILQQQAHWFHLDDLFEGESWRDRVYAAGLAVTALSKAPEAPAVPKPPFDPIDGEIESWRCGKPGSGKSYCRTVCPLNARLSPMGGKVAK